MGHNSNNAWRIGLQQVYPRHDSLLLMNYEIYVLILVSLPCYHQFSSCIVKTLFFMWDFRSSINSLELFGTTIMSIPALIQA